jgi:uncharacterized cysteine cluster protein YcgN (CxxCxxCC family)
MPGTANALGISGFWLGVPEAGLPIRALGISRDTESFVSRADAARGLEVTDLFWKTKALEEMTAPEWESLCDGCGRCCLEKLEDEDTGKIYFTHISCRLLDTHACGCKDYANRHKKVPDCVRLTPRNVRTLNWLPPTCGYRLVAEGKDLYWWHPLVSGDPDTVHQAGVSVRGRVQGCETDIALSDWEDHIVKWPGLFPKKAKEPRPK